MNKILIKNRKIAIIGGAGFIGHNLALHLKTLGADVRIIDGLDVNNLASLEGNKNLLPYPELAKKIINERLKLLKKEKIPLIIQDARQYHEFSKILNDFEPQVIIHLAAVSHANRSNKDPHSTFDHSLRTLENALDNAKNKIEHFIFLSSSMVYGNFKADKVDEESQCEPLGVYGALKFSGEKIIISYNQVFNLPYTIIRPSALYGERCISRRVGQIFIESALNNSKIEILGDGSENLDFTYIKDLVEGITKVIEIPKSKNQIFNLTFGKARSVNDMLEILKKYFPKVLVQYKPKDKLSPKRGTLLTDKAKSLLNYDPQWNLDKGYPKYIEWYKKLYEAN
jgi:nucleoside-diphosphate-sugar epimerase